jgi:hypothetical protein
MFKVPLQGCPATTRMTVRYLSGAEEIPDFQPGNLLAAWAANSKSATFSFSPDPQDMVVFDTEAEVAKIVEWLRKETAIEAQGIKVG